MSSCTHVCLERSSVCVASFVGGCCWFLLLWFVFLHKAFFMKKCCTVVSTVPKANFGLCVFFVFFVNKLSNGGQWPFSQSVSHYYFI